MVGYKYITDEQATSSAQSTSIPQTQHKQDKPKQTDFTRKANNLPPDKHFKRAKRPKLYETFIKRWERKYLFLYRMCLSRSEDIYVGFKELAEEAMHLGYISRKRYKDLCSIISYFDGQIKADELLRLLEYKPKRKSTIDTLRNSIYVRMRNLEKNVRTYLDFRIGINNIEVMHIDKLPYWGSKWYYKKIGIRTVGELVDYIIEDQKKYDFLAIRHLKNIGAIENLHGSKQEILKKILKRKNESLTSKKAIHVLKRKLSRPSFLKLKEILIFNRLNKLLLDAEKFGYIKKEDAYLLHSWLVMRKTFREIGEEKKCSFQNIAQKINKALNSINLFLLVIIASKTGMFKQLPINCLPHINMYGSKIMRTYEENRIWTFGDLMRTKVEKISINIASNADNIRLNIMHHKKIMMKLKKRYYK